MVPAVIINEFYASLRPESPRYQAWATVFDDPERVPITTPIPEWVRLPIGIRHVLFVACDLLTPEEQARLVEHLSSTFSVDRAEVRGQIEADPRHAVPLLDEDVSVTILHLQRWLGD